MLTVALNYGEINWNPKRVPNIKPSIIKYKWKGINYLSKILDWETVEKNNPIIALNILYVKEKQMCPAYVSKINLNREKHNFLNDSKRGKRRMTLSCKGKKSPLIHEQPQSIRVIFIA